MFWYIFVALLLGCIVAGFIIYFKGTGYNSTEVGIGLIVFPILALLITTTMIGCIHLDYRHLVDVHEEKRLIYETLDTDNPVIIVDIMEMNNDLLELKSQRRIYGKWFSVIPEDIFNIEPIGLPVG